MQPHPLEKPSSSPSTLKNAGIFIQNACLQHRYIRSKDLSNIVERPERLRAVHVGLAAAIARLEGSFGSGSSRNLEAPSPEAIATAAATPNADDTEDLVEVMEKMKLDSSHSGPSSSPSSNIATATTSSIEFKPPIMLIQTQATLNILSHPAVKFVHGDIDGDVYLENLAKWVRESREKIGKGESEIPEGLAQGDLYLCPESLNAIQGAAATVCEAVDRVISSTPPLHRAFVAIRPPGHHCGEDTPSGFCFLNNVAIGAAHAHLQHGIKRIVIFDIDLHHGNGTQSIVWQINEETYRQTLESEGGSPNQATGPKVYYGSLHDILSYPCEDGKPNLVQAASVSIHGSHGQYIENVHLKTYTSEEHFWEVLYKEEYSRLLAKAKDFMEKTGGEGEDVLVFISCGMDACEHEYPSMSRHNRKVPVSFYHRFARDACAFADRYAKGRLVSVLEGGYSDRALMSGAMAHVCGLVEVDGYGANVDEAWWTRSSDQKRRGGRPSITPNSNSNSTQPLESWLERTLAIFHPLEAALNNLWADRTLRDRSTKGTGSGKTHAPTPVGSPLSAAGTRKGQAKPASTASASSSTTTATAKRVVKIKPPPSSSTSTSAVVAVSLSRGGDSPLTSPDPSSDSSSSLSPTEDEGEDGDGVKRVNGNGDSETKKVPRVILKLGKPPGVAGTP
ncbi:histone deacetylase domain-containing protein [Gymnopilus junonius]|uniref:Histone deacetylase domain-containing protein n=1 Tax=Gymnopilus junonius TaxID=109634 RepID=A0A9P5NHF1_GYMJU|nr:histone deacetylase domain-containing protein [Gymnopilus junonius]